MTRVFVLFAFLGSTLAAAGACSAGAGQGSGDGDNGSGDGDGDGGGVNGSGGALDDIDITPGSGGDTTVMPVGRVANQRFPS